MLVLLYRSLSLSVVFKSCDIVGNRAALLKHHAAKTPIFSCPLSGCV
ncbi:hypothetical protein PULV_a2334 [Pseudoalteromonas ulvae UL12]|nr:hypothetical protein [Pseudoalteromonas ulvae UL12]